MHRPPSSANAGLRGARQLCETPPVRERKRETRRRLARALRDHRLPAAWVDLDRFDRNLDDLVRRAGGMPIRVASKSLRCRALVERVVQRRGCEGVMCFTPAEAVHLSHTLDDLLVAYPSVDPHEVRPVFARLAAGKTIVLTVDDLEQLEILGALAREAGQVLPLCIDVDMSLALPRLHFGVRRSPIRTPADALAIGKRVRSDPHLELVGVLGYEAQVAGLPDKTPRAAWNTMVRTLKRASIRDLRKRRGAVVRALRQEGHAIRFVNGGGTGSLESTRADPSVTEVTAGSGLYVPTLFDEFEAFDPLPAAGFALPVVRRPAKGFVTCLGGGYVASGAAGPDRLPRPFLPPGLSLLEQEGAGEVQTPLQGSVADELAIGDPVFFRHAKAGELCERFAELHLIRGDEVVDVVPTYRGEGHTFL